MVNACCPGTGVPATPTTVCQGFVKAGNDPAAACAGWTLQTQCKAVHDTLLARGECCCLQGEVCDPDHGSACVSTCTRASGCSGSQYGNSCAPIAQGGVIAAKVMVCRPDDGKAFHGCKFFSLTGCESGYECWKDARANLVCTKGCTTNADCGNPGVACCDRTATCAVTTPAKCSGTGACLPCP